MPVTVAAPNNENPCTGGPLWPPRSGAPRLFSEESNIPAAAETMKTNSRAPRLGPPELPPQLSLCESADW
jgi:hypothetical protein